MKTILSFLIVISIGGCGGGLLDNALNSNMQEMQLSQVITEPDATSVKIYLTTNIPSFDQIEYGTASGTYTQKSAVSATPTTMHEITLESLATDITYYARVIITADGYSSTHSEEFHFPTSSSINLTALTAGSITLTAADITWTTNVNTTHLVEYGTVSGTYTASTIQSTTAAAAHTVSLAGLTQNTTYYYRVRNFHATLGSVVSAEQSFSTLAETSPTTAQLQRSIWIVGGLNGYQSSTVVAQIDAYDPVTSTWYANVASAATGTYVPVSFAGVAGYTRPSDGHHLIIVIGGFDSTGVVRNLVQIYDIENNSWSNGTTMTAARANIYAARYYDKVYVIGGTTANAGIAWAGSATNYEYTIGSGWNTRTAAAANVTERFVYAYNDIIGHIGGRSAAATITPTAHKGYSITLAAATGYAEVAMSTNRTGVTGGVWIPSNGAAKVLLVGGFSALTGTATCSIVENTATTVSTPSSLFQYLNSPFTAPAVWTAGTAYPLTIGFGAAVVYGNTFYNFGGTVSVVSNPTRLASGNAAAYSTDLTALPTNVWTPVSNMPIGRFGHCAVIAF
jgi:hypothetical protein